MTLGKGFFGELLGCTLSFLLVVGLQATGRDSPSKIKAETNTGFTKLMFSTGGQFVGFHRRAKLFEMNFFLQ